MPKVKICGITNIVDAQFAVDCGADAIGFIFAESPRQITPEDAKSILSKIDLKDTVPVGVFVDETPERTLEIAGFVGLSVLQLHGDETPENVGKIASCGFDVVKSFRVCAEKKYTRKLEGYNPSAFLLDTFVPGQPGGTGKTFNWTLAIEAKRLGRIILAGGLGVDNVVEAIRTVKPYGIDASSRLEESPGVKNHELVKEFIRLVKSQPCEDAEKSTWPK